MDHNEVSNNEIMEFLQEHVATKEDLKDLGTELRAEMAGMGKELRQEMSVMKLELIDTMEGMNAEFKEEFTTFVRAEDQKVLKMIGRTQ